MEGAGTGGGGACSATLCLTGVAERGVDCVRARTGAGLLAPATRDLDGVEGALMEERDEGAWGTRDIVVKTVVRCN